MNNSKRTIMVFIVILFIIAILITTIFLLLKNLNNEEQNTIEFNNNETMQNVTKEITIKKNNEYVSAHVYDKELVSIYFHNYINTIGTNIEEAYNMLDKDYRDKKFNTLEKYKMYVNNMGPILYKLYVSSYSVNKRDDYTEYICKDQYNNIYIFKETAVMQYEVLLDEYTYENDEFVKKYENLNNNRDKGILNIDKFFRMINLLDYESAYNTLDNTFKEQNFKTQKEFENYIKTKLFANNAISYQSYSNEISSLHVYELKITDATQKNTNEIKVNVIMQLKEGTDFVMSFSIE